MSLFKRKSQEEKTLEEIKKKKQQMDKLKEEINKMGKLVLKDGKLTKVEDTVKEERKLSDVPTIPPVPTNDDVDAMVEQERMRRQQQAIAILNNPQPQQRPATQEEYNQMLMRQQAYEQQQVELQRRELIRQQQEEYEQQQYRQQPQPYQQPQPVGLVNVAIEMVTGTTITIAVPTDKIDDFIESLNNAIDNQSSFPINNKVINGRNIVGFTFD